jgi:hypothetical protein
MDFGGSLETLFIAAAMSTAMPNTQANDRISHNRKSPRGNLSAIV